MAQFSLFGSRESGHTYKVRMLLSMAGIAHQYTEIDLTQPREQRPEPFRTLAKFGEVPLLVMDGQPFVQSDAILLHLAEHAGCFGGESPERLARMREWLFWEANRIGFSLPNLRYGRRFVAGGLASAVEAFLRARFDADIARLESELSDGRAFMLDDTPTIADLALSAYMFWPEQAGVTLPPAVSAWLGRIASLPGWRHPDDMPA
ncbi:MAG: glutathione S-transferase family protein [Massilia sp.]